MSHKSVRDSSSRAPFTRREVLRLGGAFSLLHLPLRYASAASRRRDFNVMSFGAVGDGVTLDTAAIQRAIDAANAHGPAARVIVPGRHRFLVGTLRLKDGVEFHLADDAMLLASLERKDYGGGAVQSGAGGDRDAAVEDGLIVADGARDVVVSGTGSIHGRAKEFMQSYDQAGEWWVPKPWRPKMFVFTPAATCRCGRSRSAKRRCGGFICWVVRTCLWSTSP